MGSPELPQSDEPQRRVVPVDGQPIWEVCAGGLCARAGSGRLALQQLQALLSRKGCTMRNGGATIGGMGRQARTPATAMRSEPPATDHTTGSPIEINRA